MEVFVVLIVWGVSLLIAYFLFKAAVKNGVLEALKIFYAGVPPGRPAQGSTTGTDGQTENQQTAQPDTAKHAGPASAGTYRCTYCDARTDHGGMCPNCGRWSLVSEGV